MADCCLIKKVATVEVYENKNEVRAYGFMAGDRNTPVMEVRFRHTWGVENLQDCKLRWIIVDDFGSLLVGEVPIQSDNTALINLPNELFTGDRRMKVQLTVASCDGERILNLQQFTDLKVINSLAPNEVVEPVYDILINKLYDETFRYLKQLDDKYVDSVTKFTELYNTNTTNFTNLYDTKYASLNGLYLDSRRSLEDYMHTTENGGNANSLQGNLPRAFSRVENTIEELINSANGKYRDGDVVELLGYYTAGDGTGHKRKIEATDDGSGVLLVNGLWANIVHDGEVEAGWFGGNSTSNTDYKNAEIQKALNYFVGFEGSLILGFKKFHSVNTNLRCVWNNRDSYVKKIIGNIRGDFNNPNEIFFRMGIEMSQYGSIATKSLDLNISISGDCKSVLKLYTEGHPDLAFWNSSFELKLSCRRGYGLWVANGFFENRIKSLRVNLMRKGDETPDLRIGSESVGYIMSNSENENHISSVKHGFLNIWGGENSILTTSFGNKFQPDFTADEVHVFDTTKSGLVLQNQGNAGCYINYLHAEFIGKPNIEDYYACYWVGGGIINKVDGGGAINNCGMVGFLKVYNATKTPFVCNSSSLPYSMPFKKHLVLIDGRDGNTNIFVGYKFKLDNSGDVVVHKDSDTFIETPEYSVFFQGTSKRVVDKKKSIFMDDGGISGRLRGFELNRHGLRHINTSAVDYENYTNYSYMLRFSTTDSPEALNNKFSFFNKELIERRVLEAWSVESAVKVLGEFFLDMGLARELKGTAFLSTYNADQLNTPYHTLKMQQEGVYEDFIQYMDEKTEYDRLQRESENQPEGVMMLPVIEEPQPSEKLLAFKEKYLG